VETEVGSFPPHDEACNGETVSVSKDVVIEGDEMERVVAFVYRTGPSSCRRTPEEVSTSLSALFHLNVPELWHNLAQPSNINIKYEKEPFCVTKDNIIAKRMTVVTL
jgi:hypothetical protein